MKTKPKRIRAEASIYIMMSGESEPRYWIRQSDIRALAEQMAEDIFKVSDDKVLQDYVLYALKRAGMTPGKGAK